MRTSTSSSAGAAGQPTSPPRSSTLQPTVTPVPGGSSRQSVGASADGCELVELYPGYPGYRDYVTGVAAIGDHACVEDLEAMDPSFDREREDAANRAAAERLGVHGGPALWTWEIWIAIEAERGLTCYTCAMAAGATYSRPMQHNIQPDDPRLLLGFPGGQESFWRIIYSKNLTISPMVTPYENYELRAIAHLLASTPYPNAPELVAIEGEYLQRYFGEGEWFSYECAFYLRGSYARTPSTAAIEGQEFLFIVGLSVSLRQLTPIGVQTYGEWGMRLMNQWHYEYTMGRTQQSLAEFFAANFTRRC